MIQNSVTLALDTSIGSGSLSIWNDEYEIAYVLGDKSKPLSENLLLIVSDLLSQFNFELKDITRIVYTNGPGSFTGLRVGISSVLGLSNALNCNTNAVSVFEALFILGSNQGTCLTAFLQGKDEVILQEFNVDNTYFTKSEIKVLKFTEFIEYIKVYEFEILIDKNLADSLILINQQKTKELEFKNASDNIAGLAYRFYLENQTVLENSNNLPIYAKEVFKMK